MSNMTVGGYKKDQWVPFVAMPAISWAATIDKINSQIVGKNYYRNKINFIRYIYQSLTNTQLLPSSNVLDVACGTGNYLIEFAKAGFKTAGIESDLELVEEIIPKQMQAEVSTKIFWSKDNDRIENISGMHMITFFDTAINRFFLNSNSAFSWFKKFTRFLAPNGVLIIQIVPKNDFEEEKSFDVLNEDKNEINIMLKNGYKGADQSISKRVLSYTIKTKEALLNTYKALSMRFWTVQEISNLFNIFNFNKINYLKFGKDHFIAGVYNY